MAAAIPKGYTTADDVAAALGLTLTPELQAQLDPLIAAAERSIDAATGHAWLEASPTTAEPHLVGRGHFALRNLPVVALDGLDWLPEGPTTATPTTLDPSAYALVDAATGAVWLEPTSAPACGARTWLRASYQSGADVPPGVALAATEAAAASYRRASDQTAAAAAAAGVKRYSVGQELTVEFADAATTSVASAAAAGLPPAALQALAPWAPPIGWA